MPVILFQLHSSTLSWPVIKFFDDFTQYCTERMTWLTGIIDYIHYKMWDKITYPSPLKFGNGNVISSHTTRGMWLPIHAGNHVSEMGPWGDTYDTEYTRMNMCVHDTKHGKSWWSALCCMKAVFDWKRVCGHKVRVLIVLLLMTSVGINSSIRWVSAESKLFIEVNWKG